MVETIMAAVGGALAAGATDGIKEVAKSGLADGYKKLKAALARHGGSGHGVLSALDQVEAKPESKARRAVLAEELDESGLAADAEVVAQATSLLELMHSLSTGSTGGQMASGSGIAQADRHSSASVTVTNGQT